jgi:NAD(P)H dehydrogenase (quinone)
MNENRKDIMPIADTNPPRILVLGSTGRTGGAVATQIEADHHDVAVVRAARDQATVDQWRDQGLAAARLDLDDARTFPAALDGIDRLFVMTGYTVAMTHQTKMITDAAADAGVGHLVHLGIFGDGRSTEPHFAWHELVERYIEGSGIAWTHLHPHMFMENLLTTFPLRDWRFTWPAGDKPCGLIAGEDLAAVAAKVLAEGPDAHAGQGYWLSTDVLDGKGIAGALTSALGRPITADIITPDDLRAAIGAGVLRPPAFMETTYALSTLEWLQQLYDGRMDRTIYTTTTVEDLLGRPPTHLEDWAALHRAALLTSNTTSAPA